MPSRTLLRKKLLIVSLMFFALLQAVGAQEARKVPAIRDVTPPNFDACFTPESGH
jgi:hypothetical protein